MVFILIVLVSCYASASGREYDADYWQQMGDDFLEKGSFTVALDCYEKFIELDGLNASAWMKKGEALSLSLEFFYET